MTGLPLTNRQIEHLVALHVMQPATVSAVSTYLGHQSEFSSDGLRSLVAAGLAKRCKAPGGPDYTDEEITGEVTNRGKRAGKRPYLYFLTPKAADAARLFHDALTALDHMEIDKNGHRKANGRPNQNGTAGLNIENM